MKRKSAWYLFSVAVGLFALAVLLASPAWAISTHRLENASKDPNNWLHPHGTYEGWQYSPLDQINKSNVKNLKVAWIHQPGTIEHGLETAPLAVDGVVYYSASYNRVFALDGATGKEIWHYYHPLDLNLIKTLFFQPFNRGLAVGWDKIYMGTLDGKLVALDMKTGKKVWETVMADWKKCSCNITGAPLVVKDKVITGMTGGEYPIRTYIDAYDVHTGKRVWRWWVIPEPPDPAASTWGGDSWKYGGGGPWMTGSYDPALNLIYFGTGNPAPDFDWGGKHWRTEGARPGTNLYTSSIVALDADTGKLVWYFQEIPHDAWDFDAALGEITLLDVKGQKLLLHTCKGGWIFILDRTNGKFLTAWPHIKTYNWITGVDAQGNLLGRNEPVMGETSVICPSVGGGRQWNHASYNPKNGWYYTTGIEWCQEVTIRQEEPVTEPAAQFYLGGEIIARPAPGGVAPGHLDAFDPLTGELKWQVPFPYPVLGSVLATGGDLVFVGDAEGVFHAYDADTGEELWQFRVGSGHRSGPISYAVHGQQYIALPVGWGGLMAGLYPQAWPETERWPHNAILIAFALKD